MKEIRIGKKQKKDYTKNKIPKIDEDETNHFKGHTDRKIENRFVNVQKHTLKIKERVKKENKDQS